MPKPGESSRTAPRRGLGRDAVVSSIAGLVVVLMVGAAYAAVPFYNWFCRATGFNGTTQLAKVAPTAPQFFEGADYRRRFPDGRIGSDPSLSSPEHGKRLYDAAVLDMIDAYTTFLEY